ncbi:hypothetical protein TNCV_71071 [Trichonephila clavipes]|nr:hypothetical protein TNCV_71071 [Trichonephila clavipes]
MYHDEILSLGRVQLKMSRQLIPKITPKRYLQASKANHPRLRDGCSGQRVKQILRGTGIASSEGALCPIPSGPFFRYGSPVSGAVVTHVGAPVAWGPVSLIRLTDYEICRQENLKDKEYSNISTFANSELHAFEISLNLLFFPSLKLWVESVPKPDELSNVIEEVVDLARQINLEVDSNDVQELLASCNQELIIDEVIEMHEQE